MKEETFITADNRHYTLWNKIEDVLDVVIPAYYCKTKEKRRQRGWIFRGQSDARWEILPTLFRKPCSKSIIDERQRYTKSFIRALREHSSSLDIPNLDNSKMLATAQHYGFPTSFLDFTYNVEIAAFFATATNPTNAEIGVIYCFNLKEYNEMRNPFSVLGTTQEETDKILLDQGMQPLPPSVVIYADEIPRIRVEEAVFLKSSQEHSNMVMHECIDRFYFRQKPGHIYRGEMELPTGLPSQDMFDSDESYEYFIDMVKRQQPELFQKTPFIFDLLYLEKDRIAQFAANWKKSDRKPSNIEYKQKPLCPVSEGSKKSKFRLQSLFYLFQPLILCCQRFVKKVFGKSSIMIRDFNDIHPTSSSSKDTRHEINAGRFPNSSDTQYQSFSSFKRLVEEFYDGPYRNTPYQSQYIGKGRRLITKLSENNELSVEENQRWLLWELFQKIIGKKGYKYILRVGKQSDSPDEAMFYFTIVDRWLETSYSVYLTINEAEKGLWRGKFTSIESTVLKASNLEKSDFRFLDSSNYRALSDENPYYGDNLEALLQSINAEIQYFNDGEQGSFLYDLQKILMKNFGRSLEVVVGLGKHERCHLISPLVRPDHSEGEKQLIFEVYDGFFQSLKYTSICSRHWDYWCEADSNPMNDKAEIFLGLQ